MHLTYASNKALDTETEADACLQTLSTFLSAVLAKKYMNPSSDIINVLAGLDHIDTVFTDFAGALDWILRNGRSSMLGDAR